MMPRLAILVLDHPAESCWVSHAVAGLGMVPERQYVYEASLMYCFRTSHEAPCGPLRRRAHKGDRSPGSWGIRLGVKLTPPGGRPPWGGGGWGGPESPECELRHRGLVAADPP